MTTTLYTQILITISMINFNTKKRTIKTYKNSDWLYVTPNRKTKIPHDWKRGLTTSYWYNQKTKQWLTLPMEEMFYTMIGKKGKLYSESFFANKSGYISPFTKLKKL